MWWMLACGLGGESAVVETGRGGDTASPPTTESESESETEVTCEDAGAETGSLPRGVTLGLSFREWWSGPTVPCVAAHNLNDAAAQPDGTAVVVAPEDVMSEVRAEAEGHDPLQFPGQFYYDDDLIVEYPSAAELDRLAGVAGVTRDPARATVVVSFVDELDDLEPLQMGGFSLSLGAEAAVVADPADPSGWRIGDQTLDGGPTLVLFNVPAAAAVADPDGPCLATLTQRGSDDPTVTPLAGALMVLRYEVDCD
jgi:hypothetical protein